MKTVAFITIHVGENFGSNLQTIATSEVLRHLGIDPIVINYIPPRVTYLRYFVQTLKSLKHLPGRIIYFPTFVRNKRIYNSFLSIYCKVSKSIYAADNFASKCPKADFYITGSDQVWNFVWNEGLDKHYFFDGVEGVKIAYASSLGSSNLSQLAKDSFNRYLPKYKAISVREKSAVDALSYLGFNATLLIDPTFMLNIEDWKKFMSKRLLSEKYIFVYLPYNIADKDLVYRSIRKIVVQKNLKVVTVSLSYNKDRYADQTFCYANPGDFLSLIYYAEYVVTNSFHGTAFSINLNKQFWVYMPSAFSTRVSNIVDLCGLQSRILTNHITESQIDEVIDYTPVNEILDKERVKTISFFKNTIGIQ